ncbi:Arylsulfatase A [Natronoarchaeum philippinense]|uniref:Arylsulfatase A n=1 Tax=Natronoarchaeum philippinense TaxID=558529 RepID=A0A285NUD9_NATPI|nr:sulfatase-like hydrolase/transferase [Natronoarchaeum philippinense]SNZ12533.1 Arylsulfatase A [Natronoarchaeum philippinense]
MTTNTDQTTGPNVLFVLTDQQSADAMSCAGSDYVETPAMDRLADRGVRFTDTYCTQPLCNPSRASLFSGRMPHEVGASDNNSEIDERYRDEELGRLFDDAGYDCAYGGKWHVPEMTLPDEHGFETLQGMNDLTLADNCIDFLDRDRDDPFFLVASFDNPHNICEVARNENLPWGNVESVPTEECPDLPKNYGIPPFEPSEIRTLMEASRPSGLSGNMVDATAEEWRHYRHAYFRLVEKVDAEIGELLDALDERGLTENTVIVFTSDHGELNGAHQLEQKCWGYEESVRVPFIVSYPGETLEGETDDHLVSNGLDVLPTLCDYADITPPDDLDGKSVRPLAAGQDTEWRDQVVVQTNIQLGGRVVRTDRYKYIVYERGRQREQLFDLRNDPGEMVDLSENAEYGDVLAEHRERLFEWCVEHDDAFGANPQYPMVPQIPGFNPPDAIDRVRSE